MSSSDTEGRSSPNGAGQVTQSVTDGQRSGFAGDDVQFRCRRCGETVPAASKAIEAERLICRRVQQEHEEMQQSLARQIHESFAQQLVAALMHLEAHCQLRRTDPEEAALSFQAGLELLRESVTDAQRMAGQLRSPVLEEFGIGAAVGHLIREMGQTVPQIELVLRGVPARAGVPQETIAYRIVEQLLANARGNGRNGKLRLTLTQHPGRLCIEVEDSGEASLTDALAEPSSLHDVLDRARAFGAEATLTSRRDGGTLARIELPIP
jgi:signal transduction histidine kinase